jgi:ABC-2 type transport system permease protein
VTDTARVATVRHTGILVRAFIRRDWKITISYKVGMGSQIVQSVITLLFLFVLGRLVGNRIVVTGGLHESYFPFAVLGVAMLGVVNSELSAVSAQLRADQTSGTFEALLALPPPPWMTVLGSVAFPAIWASVVAIITVLAAVAGFGMRFHATVASALVGCLGMAVGLLLFAAIGVALASLVVLFKFNLPISNTIGTAFSLLGGVYYPVRLLPGPLHVLGAIIPFTWALNVVRSGLLERQELWSDLWWLAAATAVLIPASLWVFSKAVARSRMTGTLGQY